MELLGLLTSLLLTEAEQGVLVASGISHRHVSERCCETLEDLLLSLLSEEKLHVATDLVVSARIDSNEVAPFLGGINVVAHDLGVSKLSFLVEDFSWSGFVLDVAVVNR